MAPDMGTNEQMMAWFMDTYSMYQGVTVPEIVTGKPVGSGGTLGRREATGHGVAFLAFRALDSLDIAPTKATAIVQGFGNVGSHAAMGLAARGVKVIGVSDHTAAYYDPVGFDVNGAGRPRRKIRRAGRLFERGRRSTRARCSSSIATCSRHARSSG